MSLSSNKAISLNDKFTFGKYKDRMIGWVVQIDAAYVMWCVDNIGWFELDADAIEIVNRYANDQQSDAGDDRMDWEGPGDPADFGHN